jgi:hypothetical protein
MAEMLKKGHIRPSTSPYGSEIIMILKPDGSTRVCIDYRELKKLLPAKNFAFPLIYDLLLKMAEINNFFKIDLRAAYSQLRMAAGHEMFTAIQTHLGS